jgi:YidC/Oxa1 family membrane protein insertase
MDKKSISILVLCFALLLVWPSLVRKIYPPKPLPPGATNVVAAATSTNFAPAAVAFSKSALGSSTNSAVASLFDTNAPEQLLVVSNADAHYTFTSRGGGLKSVDLLHYPEKVSAIRKKRTTGGDVVTLNELSSLPVGALLDDGTAMGDGIYQLSQTPKGVRAEKILESGVAVVKEFSLSTNYLVTMSVRIENRTAASVSLPSREIAVGMATPDGARDKGQFVAVNWYDGKTEATVNAMWFANRRFGCMPGTPRAEYLEGSNNVVWVSSQNQFFTLAAMAENPALAVAARPVKLPYFADPETGVVIVNGPQPQGIETSLLYPAVKLAPAKEIRLAGENLRAIQQQRGAGDGLRRILRRLFARAAAGDELAAQHFAAALRMGNHFADGTHQARVLAAHAGEHALDEAYAGVPAADERHQGKIQGRPRQDEPQDDGVHEGK